MTRDALTPVYEAELPRLRRIAAQYLGAASPDVEDVLQDVFLQAWLHCDNLRDDGRCPCWLGRMTANACRTLLRRSRRFVPLEDTWLRSEDDVFAQMAARLSLEYALASLTPKDRQLMRLYAMENRSMREIARQMRKPEGTVKSAIHRARLALRSA